MGEWNGRTAVITGGGRGFGKAFGAALAGEGAHVVLVDIDGAAAQAAAVEISESDGSAEGICGDVTDEAAILDVMAQAATARGGIDLLVNNAGLHSHEYNQPITKMGFAKVKRLFDVNINGVVNCTLAALPHMRGRKGASIVNIASAAAHLGFSAYGNSKLAVASVTVTLGKELAADGIRVNALSPGLMLTDTIRAELTPETMQQAKALQWLEGDGEERHVVDALMFLASDKAEFITGETLRVGGGMGAGV